MSLPKERIQQELANSGIVRLKIAKGKKVTITHRSSVPGHKNDAGKPRMELIPLDALEEIAKVLTFGAIEYAPDNWKIVPDAVNRYTGALLRHLTAWQKGEEADPETGISHLAHMGCNALFLMWFELHKTKERRNEDMGTDTDRKERTDRKRPANQGPEEV